MAKTILISLFLSLASVGLYAQTHQASVLPQLPGGGGGDPPGGTPAERDALKKVVLHTFGVTPLTVKPFGTVTAGWNVTVPSNTGFDIGIELNGQAVPPVGSQSFTITKQTVFALAAVIIDGPKVGRLLRQWTVHLDTSECHVESFPTSVLTEPLKAEFDSIFSGSSKFQLKPGGTSITSGTDLINIDVPLTINVPDWFDADMDITIQLTIAGASNVFVGDPVVNANVQWSALSNWLSLGCTDSVGSGMSQMAQVFIEEIVNAQLTPAIAQSLTNQVNSFTASLKAADPQQRTYVMTSLILSPSTGLTITACPQ